VYLAYVFYPPLYVAGPIMGFNSFASQLLSRSRPPLRDTAVYVLRWAASFLLLEAMSHVLYFNAIAKHRVWARWKGDHPLAFRVADVGITGFWVLNFMWLKVSCANCVRYTCLSETHFI
jgi:D-alanyl-lipoteichoic acid acyltransferase DltB (MBOAT superfamily)